jgi:hypothetical protein
LLISSDDVMRRAVSALILVATLVIPAVAAAEPLWFQPRASTADIPAHHYLYSWRLDGGTVNTGPGSATGVLSNVRLYFDDMSNWDNSSNRLFAYLLEEATQNISYLMAENRAARSAGASAPAATDAGDDFSHVAVRASPPQDTRGESFTTADEDYRYSYAEAQIAGLADYLLNGNDMAIALDPGSRFDNDDIKRLLDLGALPQVVPEPISILLLGAGMAGLLRFRKPAPPLP